MLGGSISFGHGLQPADKRYAQLVQEGLEAAFPDAEIVVKNGAVPATGTDYFAACYKHHVPADADLFVLEGAVNDLVVCVCRGRADGRQTNSDASVHLDVITDTETLVRELLKGGAAVVMLSTWGMTDGYMNGADQHSTVAEYYVRCRPPALTPGRAAHLDARRAVPVRPGAPGRGRGDLRARRPGALQRPRAPLHGRRE